ncbi:hypothetical protein C8R47DRAFT_993354 [Mycena vitilis]|nr:hypothetical protein C8R47DRAFT_993354 [Mycena vitilis]
MPDILSNLRHEYAQLERRVRTVLRTQMGDQARLELQIRDCARFLSGAELHADIFPAAELAQLRKSINTMTRALERAAFQSADPLTVPMLSVTGAGGKSERRGRGRPRLDLNKPFLEGALKLRGPAGIARSLNCSSRTVRREAIRHGLVQPGSPVYVDKYTENGEPERLWRRSGPSIAPISNIPEDLDAQVVDILHLFPNFGRTMLAGALLARGFRVPEARIQESYLRVHGLPRHFGLVRWKLVTHSFIDGKSRFITGIRVSDNNRAGTVLNVFECGVAIHGCPSRVLQLLFTVAFIAYPVQRSVHNIRIERLWVDFTTGIGAKWADFFFELEIYYGLCHDNPAHIWLLHHLFLETLNQEVQEWAEAWNSHKVSMDGARRQSPREMFTFGLLEQGPRGLAHVSQAEEDEVMAHIDDFGIDWEAGANARLLQHFATHNDHPWSEADPFATFTAPETLTGTARWATLQCRCGGVGQTFSRLC